MPRITGDVVPQSRMFPMADPKRQERAVLPLRRRMAAAFEQLQEINEAEKQKDTTSPKTVREIGRLVLEMEKVNNNLNTIQDQVRKDISNKKRIFQKEKKLFEEEEKNLFKIRGALFDLRSKIALFAGAAAVKSFSEGKFGQGVQNLGIAGGAMLPEIASMAATLVLGKLALGGGGPASRLTSTRRLPQMPKARLPRMGGRTGAILAGGGLLAAGLAGSQSRADERRQELIARQQGAMPIGPGDVDRFNMLLDRFDAILSGLSLTKRYKEAKKVVGEGTDVFGDGTGDGTGGGGGGGPVTPINFSQDKMVAMAQAAEKIGMRPEALAGIIQAESGGDPQRVNQIGRAGLIQMGPNETASFGVDFEDYKKMTFNQQLNLVVRYFKQRGFKPGMTDLQAYKTVHGGNPFAPNTRDANNVTTEGYFKSHVAPAIRSYQGKFDNLRPVQPTTEQPQVSKPSGPTRLPVEPAPQTQGTNTRRPYRGKRVGPQSMNIFQLPGQRNVLPVRTASAPSTPNFDADPNFDGSYDKFTSNLILGGVG